MNYYSLSSIIIMSMMIVVSFISSEFRPTHYIADSKPLVSLEDIVPKSFSDWSVLSDSGSNQIVNPELEKSLSQIYTQTISRTYKNSNNDYIMLSIAYGRDQSDAKQLHYPEVCYPAQGFQMESSSYNIIKYVKKNINVKQLIMTMGPRIEPITYWTTVGNKIALDSREAKFIQLEYGIEGQIPDGLLFRVSSIDQNTKRAYSVHADFINKLLSSLDNDNLNLFIGE